MKELNQIARCCSAGSVGHRVRVGAFCVCAEVYVIVTFIVLHEPKQKHMFVGLKELSSAI